MCSAAHTRKPKAHFRRLYKNFSSFLILSMCKLNLKKCLGQIDPRYGLKVKPVEAENLDHLLAEFFYGCNIPFQVIDSKFFKKFVHALRPAYNPPHRHLLAGKLLDKTHEKIETRNVKMIENMDKEQLS